MRNLMIGTALSAVAIIIVGVGLLGKESRRGKQSPTYEITLPDGIYTLVAPHALSDKELKGWLKGACTVEKCPVASESWLHETQ